MQVGIGYSPSFSAVIKAPDIGEKLGKKCDGVIDNVIEQSDTINENGISLKYVFNSHEVTIASEDLEFGPRLCVTVRPPKRQKTDLIIFGKPVSIFGKRIQINDPLTPEQELYKGASCTLKNVDPSDISEKNVAETIYRAYGNYKDLIAGLLKSLDHS